jgi:hypothetical protein
MSLYFIIHSQSELTGPHNDKVHAAGAGDIDFKTRVAARSRATPVMRTLQASREPFQVYRKEGLTVRQRGW